MDNGLIITLIILGSYLLKTDFHKIVSEILIPLPKCSLVKFYDGWNLQLWLQSRVASFAFFQILYNYYFTLGVTMRKDLDRPAKTHARSRVYKKLESQRKS